MKSQDEERFTHRKAGRTKLFIIAALICGLCSPSYAGNDRTKRIALLPFENISGQTGLSSEVTAYLEDILKRKGYEVVSGKMVEAVLYKDRVRKTGGISIRNARALKEGLGVDYVMVGTFYLFAMVKGNPQFGLAARVVSADGAIQWANTAGSTGEDFTRILGFGTVRTFPELIPKVISQLFYTLPRADEDFGPKGKSSFLSGSSIPGVFGRVSGHRVMRTYVSEVYKLSRPIKVALLPFENFSERMGAARIITDIFLAEFFNARIYDVLDMGEVEEKIVEEDVWPYGGLVDEGVKKLRKSLNVDAVIVGTVENYDEGLKKFSSTPNVRLSFRMLSAREGEENKILWASYLEGSGKDTQVVLEFGLIRSILPLTIGLIDDTLSGL